MINKYKNITNIYKHERAPQNKMFLKKNICFFLLKISIHPKVSF